MNSGDGRSGGIDISGSVGSVGGDMVGRDKITGAPSPAAFAEALRPLAEAIAAAPPPTKAEAEAKLAELQAEAAKGKGANDGRLAKLLDGIVALVPGAATAVVSAFATPILAGLTGPVTAFVLEKLRTR
jgi:hypothetical protein